MKSKKKAFKLSRVKRVQDRFPRSVKFFITSIIIGTIGISSIFVKIVAIHLNGYLGYYTELVFYTLMPIGSGCFALALATIFGQCIFETPRKPLKESVKMLIVVATIILVLAAITVNFVPKGFVLAQDLKFRVNGEYRVVEGVLQNIERTRQNVVFEVGGIYFGTEHLSIRKVVTAPKEVKVYYLPHSKHVLEVVESCN